MAIKTDQPEGKKNAVAVVRMQWPGGFVDHGYRQLRVGLLCRQCQNALGLCVHLLPESLGRLVRVSAALLRKVCVQKLYSGVILK